MAKYLRVLYDFTAEEEGEMSINVGDVVQFMNNVSWLCDNNRIYASQFSLNNRKMMIQRMAGFTSTPQKMRNADMYQQITWKMCCLRQLPRRQPLYQHLLLLRLLRRFLQQKVLLPPLTWLRRPLPAHHLANWTFRLCCINLSKPLHRLLPQSLRCSPNRQPLSTNSNHQPRVFRIWFASLTLLLRRAFQLSQLRWSAMTSTSSLRGMMSTSLDSLPVRWVITDNMCDVMSYHIIRRTLLTLSQIWWMLCPKNSMKPPR